VSVRVGGSGGFAGGFAGGAVLVCFSSVAVPRKAAESEFSSSIVCFNGKEISLAAGCSQRQ
jgi:hypothetical protein